MIAHNGSGFDSYVGINNLLQWGSVVKLIKNGAGIISPKLFNGYEDKNKKIIIMFILDVEEFILVVV